MSADRLADIKARQNEHDDRVSPDDIDYLISEVERLRPLVIERDLYFEQAEELAAEHSAALLRLAAADALAEAVERTRGLSLLSSRSEKVERMGAVLDTLAAYRQARSQVPS